MSKNNLEDILYKHGEVVAAFFRRAVVVFDGDNITELSFARFQQPSGRDLLVGSAMLVFRFEASGDEHQRFQSKFLQDPAAFLRDLSKQYSEISNLYSFVKERFQDDSIEKESQIDYKRISDKISQATWALSFGGPFNSATLDAAAELLPYLKTKGYTHFMPFHGDDEWHNFIKQYRFYLVRDVR